MQTGEREVGEDVCMIRRIDTNGTIHTSFYEISKLSDLSPYIIIAKAKSMIT